MPPIATISVNGSMAAPVVAPRSTPSVLEISPTSGVGAMRIMPWASVATITANNTYQRNAG